MPQVPGKALRKTEQAGADSFHEEKKQGGTAEYIRPLHRHCAEGFFCAGGESKSGPARDPGDRWQSRNVPLSTLR